MLSVEVEQDDICPVGEAQCEVIDALTVLRNENASLRRQLTIDGLTGLHNYRFFVEALEQEMERTRRGGLSTSLIMVDLDHFKRLNDTYGHEAGNVALRQTADILREMVRKLDFPCRYGGEEFAIVLASTPLAAAARVAERIRAAVAAAPVRFDGQVIPLTASLGLDDFTRGQTDTANGFIHRVDQYLYLAKEGGRDRIAHPELRRIEVGQVSADERRALFS